MSNAFKKAALALPGVIPGPVTPIVAQALGRAGYRLHELGPFKGYLQRAVMRALDVEFREADRIIRANFRHMANTLLEVARTDKLRREWPRLVRLEGREYLDAALAAGKGAILLTAHLGNFELMLRGLPLAGIPLHVVVWQQAETFENRYLDMTRRMYGAKILYSQDLTTAQALGVLNVGGLILIVGDNYNLGRNELPFFGFPTHIPAGPIHYSLKSGAPIIPIYTLRHGRRHHVIVEPPLQLPDEGDVYQKGLELCVSMYERWIRSCPEQYLWIMRIQDWGKPMREARP